MKLGRNYFSNIIGKMDDSGSSEVTGLSGSNRELLMKQIENLDKKVEKPKSDKVKGFDTFVRLANVLAEKVFLDLHAESFEKYGQIDLKGNAIAFPVAIEPSARKIFAELIDKADDVAIYQRDGHIIVNLVYTFC